MARSVTIIGAGPAGMSAAIEAVRRGCRVTLIDEAARPGGQIYRQSHPALDAADVAEHSELGRKRRLLAAFARIRDRIDYRPDTSAYAVFGPGEVHVASGDRTATVTADCLILTTGVREVAVPFPGWTTPGVVYAGGAQALLKSQRVLPGRRVVVAGSGPLPVVVASQILRAGGAVPALALVRSLTAAARDPAGLWQGRAVVAEGVRYLATLLRARVPRLVGHVPVRVVGHGQVEAVVVARIDETGAVLPGTEREIACDALALNYGFAANAELVAMAGAEMHHDRETGGWLPKVDAWGRTSVPNLFVAGDAAGLRGALVAEVDGEVVGGVAANGLDPGEPVTPDTRLDALLERRRRLCAFQGAMRRTMSVPKGLWGLADDDTTVCRCENVTLAKLRFAFEAGHLAPNTMKRTTRAGMGWCGGRTCLPAISALAELHSGASPQTMMTPRPLARPVPLDALARRVKETQP